MLYMGRIAVLDIFPAMVVSEPSYALGGLYPTASFGSPEEARSAFQKLGINYFALNLRRQFMIGLPFSPIFKPENVRKYFEIVWSEGFLHANMEG